MIAFRNRLTSVIPIGTMRKLRNLITLLVCSVFVFTWLTLREDAILGGEASPQEDIRVGRRIFFLETSGSQCLTLRQLCGVESAARHNPQMNVEIHFIEPRKPKKLSVPPKSITYRDCTATSSIIESLANIKVSKQSLSQLLESSTLHQWYLNGSLRQSVHPTIHASDISRMVLLNQSGGIYLDFDCIVLRSLDPLKNCLGMRNPTWLETGVVALDPGHPLLDKFFHYVRKGFRPKDYLGIGPTFVTRLVQKFCDDASVLRAKTYNCVRNSSIEIRKSRDFYPINWEHRMWFYQKYHPPYIDGRLNDSFVIHVYGNDEPDARAVKSSLYNELAAQHCPLTHRMSVAARGVI